jgi:EF-hand domain pair
MRHARFPRRFASYASIALGLAVGACSGESAPGLKSGLEGAFVRAAPTWDLNHDGDVTCEEWKQYVRIIFKESDLDRDGKLTPDEFKRMAKVDRLFELANFEYYDTDKKGYVTEADMLDKPNPAFVQLDKQNTCVLKAYQLRASIMHEEKKSNPGMASTPGGGPGGR